MLHFKRWRGWILGLGFCGLGATGAAAQGVVPEIQIDREAVDIVKPHPEPAAVESVLVFTNHGAWSQWVRCVARNERGDIVGRVRTEVPGRGLRYVLASDFGGAFLGSAACSTRGRIVGSGFLLAPGLSDLPVSNRRAHRYSVMRFDVLTYRP